MNKLYFGILLSFVFVSDVWAEDKTVSVGVSTELISPGVDIDCSRGLEFGNVAYTGNGGSIKINVVGGPGSVTRTITNASGGSITKLADGSMGLDILTWGICDVTVSSGVSASIGSITQGASLGTGLTVDQLHTYPTVGSSLTAGTTTGVLVGGRLTVSSGATEGTYDTGTFSLTINY